MSKQAMLTDPAIQAEPSSTVTVAAPTTEAACRQGSACVVQVLCRVLTTAEHNPTSPACNVICALSRLALQTCNLERIVQHEMSA